MKQILLVDMDGVIADIEVSLQRHIDEHFPHAQLTEGHEERWEWEEKYDLQGGDLSGFFNKPGTFRNIPVMAGAQEAVGKLTDYFEVFICSAPTVNQYCASEKQAWVIEHFPYLRRRLILTKDKTLVHGHLLIDDKPVITGIRQPSWQHIVYHPSMFTWDKWTRLIASPIGTGA